MSEAVYRFLGLGQKAGFLLSGDMQIRDGIKKRKGFLLILSEDASPKTAETYRMMAERQKLEIRVFGEKYKLGQYLGKSERTAVLITDEKFGKAVRDKLDTVVREDRVWQNTESTN
jgi:ribosomal protein L7Ae-like RNA K-turn-binding protein